MEQTIALERLGLIWPDRETKLDGDSSDWGADADRLEGDETMAETTPQEEAELLAGFLARQRPAENTLFEKLRPLFRQKIRRNYPGLWEASADIQQSAFLKLCELRDDPVEVRRVRPPLDELATYLVHAPARVVGRAKRNLGTPFEIKEWDGSQAANQETSAHLKQLMRLVSTLPKQLAVTLHLNATHELGEGPPLHEALGIDKYTARRRLVYAQDALLTLSRREADDEVKND